MKPEVDATTAASGMRIVALIVEPIAYRLVDAWVARHGHQLTLLVTSPGPPHTWHNRGYHDLVGIVPQRQDVLVSTRMRGVVAPLLEPLAPDLLVAFTFPHRIPPEVVAVPRFGAVNLHPTPLPAYRGPNPRRMLADGTPTLGATLHRIESGFDAGAVLSRREQPLPPELTPERVRDVWFATLAEALEEGARRALAGEWGTPQDEADASYAATFTDEERQLDWSWPVARLQRQALALTLFHPEARATIAGEPVVVHRLTTADGPAPGPPGTIIERTGDQFLLAAGDGTVDVTATPATDNDDPAPLAGW